MPARCSAIAVTGPAMPPPTIRTLVMTLPRTAIRQVLGSTLPTRPGGAITQRCPSRCDLRKPHARPGMHQRAIGAAALSGLAEQLQLSGAGHRLGAVGHPELVQDVADVLFGGV